MIDGKDKYETFPTEKEAEKRARELKLRTHKQGQEAAGVPADDVLRWEKINSQLLDLGSSLAEAGEKAVEDLKKMTQRGTLGEMRAAFFDAVSKDLEDNSIRDLRRRIVRFCNHLGGDAKPASNVGSHAVTSFLGSLKSGMQDRKNYRTVLNRWLGWSALNGWLPANPVPPLQKGSKEKKKRRRGKAVTLTPGEARSLLRAAIESKDLQVVSHLAISLFGGLRPEEFRGKAKINGVSRTVTTDWEDLKRGMVHVKEECSKIKMGRQFKANSTLTAWLKWIQAEAPVGSLKGPILSGYWTTRWKKWRRKHANELLGNMRGRGKGPADENTVDRRDVLRHTYGSCRMAQTRSATDVAHEMGNSPDVVLQYYYDYKSMGKTAREFWSLTPDEVMKTAIIELPKKGHSKKVLSA